MSGGSSPRGPRPPSWARRLAALGVRPADREEILDDLLEGFLEVRVRRGHAAAYLWYVREALSFALVGIPERVRAASVARRSRNEEGWLPSLWADARAAARGLRRSPRFTLAAVTTLALGVGGATAMLSVVDGVLLRPLPYQDSGRLVALLDTFQDGRWWSSAPGHLVEWRERSRTLESIGWAQPGRRSLLLEGEPRQVSIQQVSPGLLQLLRVRPLLGRGFRPEEETAAGPAVAMVTHELWSRMGADPDLPGTALILDEVAHTVVGVLPPGEAPTFLGEHEILVPRTFTEEELRSSGRVLQSVGRLAPGVDPAAVGQELSEMVAERDGGSGWAVVAVPLREHLVRDVRASLLVLLGAASALLLVACVNVANLLLARGSTRRAELAVRGALGARRGRLVRQLLTESVALAGLGGLLGVAVAVWSVDAFLALAPEGLPGARQLGVSPRIFAAAAGVSLLTGLGFGLVPALSATGTRLGSVLRSARRGSTAAGGLGGVFVALETAFVLILLSSAGLMLTSFHRLRSVDPGFPTADRLVLEVTLPEATHPDTRSVSLFFQEMAGRVRELPGVEEAGVVSHPPLAGDDWSSYHIVESRPPHPGEEPIGGMEAAGPGYFRALGVPLLEGRTFTADDLGSERDVVVVDEAMVSRYWSDGNPLGDRVRLNPSGAWYQVVGVVGAVRYSMESDPRPRLYLPDDRLPFDAYTRSLVVRAEPGRQDQVERLLREELRAMAPRVAVGSLVRMDDAARSSVAAPRFRAALLLAFAAVGLLLGAVGIYGVVSSSVARRTREVGVRMALGAQRGRLLRRFLLRALAPVLAGLGSGLGGVLLLDRFLQTILFEVRATDPVVLGIVGLLLLVVATGSALGPGLQAARMDPVRALRAE